MNPVLAYHKEEKAKALKKSQRATTKLRTEKLSKRNASKLEQQIETLESAPALRPHEQKHLEELRRELNAVLKAKKTLGIDAGGVGKRKREEEVKKEDVAGEGKTDRERQRERREGLRGGNGGEASVKEGLLGEDTDSSDEEVGRIPMPPGPLPPLPGAPVAQTTYEAKPMIRDFIKEAAAFVPRNIVVQKKKEEVVKKEEVEEEDGDDDDDENVVGDEEMGEAEEEKEYRERKMQEGTAAKATAPPPPTLGSMYRINAAPDVDLEEKVKRFEVEMEDVEDQGN